VSLYTVSRELGHGSEDMVRRVYSHLGEVRHRSAVVEFRVEQHIERLGDRLQRLGLRGRLLLGTLLAGTTGPKRNPPPRPKSKRGNYFRRAGDRTRTGDVQLGKLAFYH
jgi:hypothetical protein